MYDIVIVLYPRIGYHKTMKRGFAFIPAIVIGLLALTFIGGVVYVTTRAKLTLAVGTPTVSVTETGVRTITVPYTLKWKSLKIANEAAAEGVTVSCSGKSSSVAQSNPVPTDQLEYQDSLTLQVKDPKVSGAYEVYCRTQPNTYKSETITTLDLPKETESTTETTDNSNQNTSVGQTTFTQPSDLSKSVWTYRIDVGGGVGGELTFDGGTQGDVGGVYNESGPSGFRVFSFTGTYSGKILTLNLEGTVYTLTLTDDYKSMKGKPQDTSGGIAYPDNFFSATRKE